MRNTLLVWLALTAAALTLHFAVTRSEAVPVVYVIASGIATIPFQRRARLRLAHAAGIRGRSTRAQLKMAAIDFAVEGMELPPNVEREYLRSRRFIGLVALATFIAVGAMLRF